MHNHFEIFLDVLIIHIQVIVYPGTREYESIPVVIVGSLMNTIVTTVDQFGTSAEEKVELHDCDQIEHDVDPL